MYSKLGVEPLALMRSLMDLVHRVTVAQIGRNGADAPTAEERARLEEWAERLTAAQLHRLWQLLLKGHDEVRGAPDPQVAAQMAARAEEHREQFGVRQHRRAASEQLLARTFVVGPVSDRHRQGSLGRRQPI